MAGRIRSIKPEILENARTGTLDDEAWRLYVSLFLLADDYDPRVEVTIEEVGGVQVIKNNIPSEIQAFRRRIAEHPPIAREYVYFIQESGDLIKIGRTWNMKGRLAQLQKRIHPDHRPLQFEVLSVIPGDTVLEHFIHRKFAQHRVFGEWFKPDVEIFDYIDLLARIGQ